MIVHTFQVPGGLENAPIDEWGARRKTARTNGSSSAYEAAKRRTQAMGWTKEHGTYLSAC